MGPGYIRSHTCDAYRVAQTPPVKKKNLNSSPVSSGQVLIVCSMSQAYGPFRPIGHLSMPHDAKTLAMRSVYYRLAFRGSPSADCHFAQRSFNDNQLSVTFYLHGSEEIPWVMIRDLKGGQPWVTRRGAHELCIQREAPSSLVFSRWSRKENRIKLWASLSFITYEGMLFSAALAGLSFASRYSSVLGFLLILPQI